MTEMPYVLPHRELDKAIAGLRERFSFLQEASLGSSLYGLSIPLLALGEGEKEILFVGAHHGSEWITVYLLMRFLSELCESAAFDGKIGSMRFSRFRKIRRATFVPLLNPDGVELAVYGVTEICAWKDRLLQMNGSDFFGDWQANGRGVDLNHNYDAGFAEYKRMEAEMGLSNGAKSKYSGAYPESEPESRMLASYIRERQPSLIVTLHSQGEEIYPSHAALASARILARLTGYQVKKPEGTAAYGGLTDWAGEKLGISALTLECGKGKNPLPTADFPAVYQNCDRDL